MKKALVLVAANAALPVVECLSISVLHQNHTGVQQVASSPRSTTQNDALSRTKDSPLGLVQLGKQVPTVKHQKQPGNGYVKGSPLYQHQEAQRTAEEGQQDPVAQVVKPWWSAEEGIVGSIVYVAFIFLIAYLYRQHRDDGIMTEISPYQGDEFTHGFCDICHCANGNGKILFWTFCCPAIRWADTVSHVKVRFLKFYVALAAFVAFAVLASGLRGSWLAAVFSWGLLAMGVYFRQRLRGVFGHAKGTVKTIALDVLAWLCCPCCAIVQEAKEAEQVFIK